MSTQRGNVKRTRPQKYKNETAFKNNLYNPSKKQQTINNLDVCYVSVDVKYFF